MYPKPSHSASVHLSVYPTIWKSVHPCLTSIGIFSLNLTASVTASLRLSLFVCLSMYMSVFLCLPLVVCLSLSVTLSTCRTFKSYLTLSPRPSLSISHSLSSPDCPYLCLYCCLSVSQKLVNRAELMAIDVDTWPVCGHCMASNFLSRNICWSSSGDR